MKRCPLVYDTHELETETVTAKGFRRVVARIIERSLIGFADCVAVVGEEIGKWYMRRYGLAKVWVIQNMPARGNEVPVPTGRLRQAVGLIPHQRERIFLYQGLLTWGRGIEIMLEAFSSGKICGRLILMGEGPLDGLVQSTAAASNNIHYLPSVPQEDLMQYTADADVGLCLIENSCLSYYLSLPNKLFEYLAAGVPVIVSEFPEMSRLVTLNECGWVVPPTADGLTKMIELMDEDDLCRRADGARRVSPTITWDSQEAILADMYRFHAIGEHV